MGRSLKKGPFVNAKLLKAIDEMNAAMKTAGLDKIIAEKQSQLDAWLALQD